MKRMIIAIAISAAVLFGANWGLRDIGAEKAQEEHVWLMQTLLPGSTEFVRETYVGDDANIRSVHRGENGFVIGAMTRGYAGDIAMYIGVNTEGKVTGLVVIDAHETWGLGGRVLTDHQFLCQFLNQTGSFTVGTAGADAFSSATQAVETDGAEVEVDAISGATVTSKAVARCVTSAVSYVTGADVGTSATTWGE